MKRRWLSALALTLAIALLAGCDLPWSKDGEDKPDPTPAVSGSPSDPSLEDRPDYTEQINAALDYYRNTVSTDGNFTGGGYWHASFLAATGARTDETLAFAAPKITSESLGEGAQASSYANAIVSLVMLGHDPATYFEGRDLPAELAAMQMESGAFPFISNGEKTESIDVTLFCMIALNISGMPYNENGAAAYLRGRLLTDGGLAEKGETGNVDTTAAAVIATGRMAGEDAKEVLNSAMKFLMDAYGDDGFFKGAGKDDEANAATQSIAILAMLAAGENIYSEKWRTAEGGNMVDALLLNQDENGGFWYDIGEKDQDNAFFTSPDEPTTAEALFTLACVQANRLLWYSYTLTRQ